MKKVIFSIGVFCFFSIFIVGVKHSVTLASAISETRAYIDPNANTTMVPLRFVSQELGASVEWQGETRRIIIKDGATTITLTIGSRAANVNGKNEQLLTNPVIVGSSTYVPIRFVSEILKAQVDWLPETRTVRILKGSKEINLYVPRGESTSTFTRVINVNGQSINVNVVKVDLSDPNRKLEVALAHNRVGAVESLEDIAKRNQALAAVNGTFFDAYTDIKEPYGVIVSKGEVVHIGREKSVFGFNKNNEVKIDVLNPSISGRVGLGDRTSNEWYAFWLNRTPSKGVDSANIFTKERGSQVGFNYGTNVVVTDGKVSTITTGNSSIPSTGFVINFQGATRNSLLNRFSIGTPVSYQVKMNPKVTADDNFWNNVQGAVAAGPRLVQEGKISVRTVEEGFTQDNILRQAATRSAIGVTKDNYLLIVTTPRATMNQMGVVMHQLGAVNAMNLDGGASSGLYYNGKYLSTPGRQISNAILIK